MITKIISGGQSGVDRAALDVALRRGIPCGGWCPKGRRAEDGPISDDYPLMESDARDYSVRTQKNIEESDGTLILTSGPLTGGTALTRKLARQKAKPNFVVDIRKAEDFGAVEQWLHANRIRTLNVAGPRESQQPGIHEAICRWLDELLNRILI